MVTFLVNDDVAGSPAFAFVDGLNIPDFSPGTPQELETALEAYDKHRDMHKVIESLRIVYVVPQPFDGSPEHLLDQDGNPIKPIQIGDIILAPNVDGKEVPAKIEDMSSMGERAYAIVYDEQNKSRFIINIPLTNSEVLAAQKYGDAIFGKTNIGRNIAKGDLWGLYNSMLDNLSGYSKDQLLRQLPAHPQIAEYEKLSPKELHKRVAREFAKRMFVQAQQKNSTKSE